MKSVLIMIGSGILMGLGFKAGEFLWDKGKEFIETDEVKKKKKGPYAT